MHESRFVRSCSLPERGAHVVHAVGLLLHGDDPDVDKVFPREVRVGVHPRLVQQVQEVVLSRVLAQRAQDVANLSTRNRGLALE